MKRSRTLRLAGTAGLALAVAAPAAAVDRAWKVATSGAFGTGTNWTGNVVPGAADNAFFGQTGSAAPFTVQLFTQSFTVANLSVTNQVPQFNLANGGACCATLTVNGLLAVRAGTPAQPVSFLQGTIDVNLFRVAFDGVGGAARLAGATLTCTDFSVGSGNSGSVGSLELTAGSTLIKDACCDAEIGVGVGNVGTMIVDDSDVVSAWQIMVGRGGANGTLELRNGAQLDFNGNHPIRVGFAENAVTSGTFNVLSGSSVDGWALAVGDGAPATGSVTIDAGSLILGEALRVGNAGGVGDMTVSSGSTVAANQLYVGDNGGQGELTVTGPKSFVRGMSGIGLGTPGQPVGLVQILDGAHASSLRLDGSKHFAFLGIGPGASGTAIVSGAGSLWSDIDWLTVGGVFHTNTGASGSVAILDGGRVECQRGIIAERPSDSGIVTVEGPGSTWAISGQLVVGNAPPEDGGDGDLIIRNGGQVTCTTMGIGSTGSLSVELGSGSTAPAIVASGNATLGGSFTLTLGAGFRPAPGVPIPIISAGSLGGTFAAVSLPSNAILEQVGGQLRVVFAEEYVDLEITPGTLQATVGYTTQAAATAIGTSGATFDVSALATWSSSDPAVLSVDGDGTLFGVAAGRATISASFEGFVADAVVTVAPPAEPSAFEILSVTASGVQSDTPVPASVFPDVSDDGRLVLLWTSSEVLTGPTPGPIDIVVKDRASGAVDLVNRNAAGVALVVPSIAYATMSGDGRLVAFVSDDPAAIPNAPAGAQVYVRDRQTGTVELASRANDGSLPNGSSGPGWISGDGRFVAFRSTATNLVAGVSGIAGNQIYLRDRLAGTTKILSAANGVAANGTMALAVAITANGDYVTFQSSASNLVPGDGNGLIDVFRVTTATGAIERVSLTASGGETLGGDSTASDISNDGQRILILSDATNLVPGHNGFRHVYLRDLAAGTTVLVTRTESGEFSPGGSGSIAISGDGKYASFRTAGSLMAADANASDDVYRYAVEDESLVLVSASSVTGAAVGGSQLTAISPDGGIVVFASPSSELAPFDQNGVSDWFLWRDETPIVGDVNGDGAVTAADLALLLGAWGTADPSADLDGDGTVGAADLAILLGGWTG